MSPGTGLGGHYEGGRGRRGREQRVAQHGHRFGLGVVAVAVRPGSPVGEPVRVEHEGGAGRQGDGLLAVGRQSADATAADAEQHALVPDLKRAHGAVQGQQGGGVAGVGERQLARPRVVDEVDARHGGRVAAGADGRRGAAPFVELAHDVGGRLLVLGVGAQRGTELPHRRRRPGAAAFDVADRQADATRGQRDDVVPVPADLRLDALPLGGERLGGHIAERDLKAVELGRRVGQQRLLEGERGPPLRLEQHGVVDGDRHPRRDRADEVAVGQVVVRVGPVTDPGQGQRDGAEQFAPRV